MDIEVGGFLGFILLIVDVWAIVKVIQSQASTGNKVFWVVLILLPPLVGVILWFFLGPKGN